MTQADDAVAVARAQIGKPYVYGTQGAETFDCSGLMLYAYGHANPPVSIPRVTYDQILAGTEVTRADLQPGDLVFPYSDLSHVAMYSGNNNIIEAAKKDTPVHEVPVY